MIKVKHRGSFGNTERFLKKVSNIDFGSILIPYGEMGVAALSASTPKRSGEAANLWEYHIEASRQQVRLVWTNSKMAGNTPLVILIQYGHGTGTGGYVKGQDFINPTMKPIFDQIEKDVWREVTRA